MKIALVDDDPHFTEMFAQLCRAFFDSRQLRAELSCFPSGETFVDSLAQEAYAIVFLDIFMDGMDGISAARKLRERSPGCLLIFLTTSTEHMPDAFSCHAFDYLVKPVQEQDVRQMLRDALRVLPLAEKSVVLPDRRLPAEIPLNEILSVVTDAHYIEITLRNGGKVRRRMTLSAFQQAAGNDPRLIQINKGILVNAEHLPKFEENSCLLADGTRLPVRVRDSRQIECAVQNYYFSKLRGEQRQPRREEGTV